MSPSSDADDLDELPDDPSISDDTELWRRVHPKQFHTDENSGEVRPSTAAFNDREMSVVIAAESRGVDAVLAGYDEYGLVSFRAGFARELGQRIVRDPTPDEPAHALVIGAKPNRVLRAFAYRSPVPWVRRLSSPP